MAKACAYLCRQCCFIDGFGEFGEFTFVIPPKTTKKLRLIVNKLAVLLILPVVVKFCRLVHCDIPQTAEF